MDSTTIGPTLKSLRFKASLTLSELGYKLKLTKSALSRYENGSREPDLDTIHQWARTCGYDAVLSFNQRPKT